MRSLPLLLLALAVLSVPAHACPMVCSGERLGSIVVQHRRLPFVAPAPLAADATRGEPRRAPIAVEHGPRHPARWRHVDRRWLLREIANVARLLRVTPRDSSDRPRVLRRLADDYAELASAAREQAKPSEARLAERASRKAIALYQSLVREHPRYCHSPARKRAEDRGCNDEALHYLAAELVQNDRKDDALEAQRAIVRFWPRSPYAAHAQLAIGEHHFELAPRDASNWKAAGSAYRAALARSPSNDLAAYLHYKLGHVEWSAGDAKSAQRRFVSALDFASRAGSSAELVRFRDAVRRDLVLAYAQVGEPARAFASFARVAGDKALSMTEQLARHLGDSGKHAEAILVYRELLERKPRCTHRVAIARAVAAQDARDKGAIRAALDELRSVDGCRDAIARMLFDTAAAWHAEALGSGAASGSGDRATIVATNELYGWLDDFSDAKGLPERVVLRYRQADVLHALGRWSECGRAFFDAFSAEPKGELARDALSASAACWLRAGDADRPAAARTFERARCLLEAPQDDRPARELFLAIARAHSCR